MRVTHQLLIWLMRLSTLKLKNISSTHNAIHLMLRLKYKAQNNYLQTVCEVNNLISTAPSWADPERKGHVVRTPSPGKWQVVIGFLRNTCTDPIERQFDPLGPIASRGMSVQPPVTLWNMLMNKIRPLWRNFLDPRMGFSTLFSKLLQNYKCCPEWQLYKHVITVQLAW